MCPQTQGAVGSSGHVDLCGGGGRQAEQIFEELGIVGGEQGERLVVHRAAGRAGNRPFDLRASKGSVKRPDSGSVENSARRAGHVYGGGYESSPDERKERTRAILRGSWRLRRRARGRAGGRAGRR